MAEILSDTCRYAARRSLHEARAIQATHIRPDIQGLRALAVLAVLLFHIWPNVIPGGFVGVDVFFVISGYLITGMLFREMRQTGGIALVPFYIRRMKRLLPAATLVLLVVTALTMPLLPPSRWEDTAIEILASAFYLENWRLAWLAVDYLGAGNAASPVQHFWSLSIEEQFYIGWPLAMIGAGLVSRRFADQRTAIMIPLLLIVAISFGASLWLTQTDREAAYFFTHTRIWQLGLGGLLAVAVLPDFSRPVREVMRTIGIGAIVLSALAFSTLTAFPGYAALLPTLGCALVIAAGTDSGASNISISNINTWSIARVLAARPAQYLGDMSYSVYLWHWPMVVFAGAASPGGMSLTLGLTLLAATLAISYLSKRFVEDPIRYADIDLGKALVFTGGFITCCIIGAAVIYQHIAVPMMGAHAGSPDYPGARAFLAGAAVPSVDAPIPPLTLLHKDKGDTYKANCHVRGQSSDLVPCRYGPETGKKVVLIGDSHAANWAPALISKLDDMGWRLEAQTKSACPLLKKSVAGSQGPYLSCNVWGANLLNYLRASPPDFVILSQQSGYRLAEADERQPRQQQVGLAVADMWRELLALGIKVVAIRDTPRFPFDPGECLARDPNCAAEQSQVVGDDDPIMIAHGLMPDVPVIDMTDAFCQHGKCPMVIGNVIVWRDSGHFTASFSRTTGAVLTARIAEALGGHPSLSAQLR